MEPIDIGLWVLTAVILLATITVPLVLVLTESEDTGESFEGSFEANDVTSVSYAGTPLVFDSSQHELAFLVANGPGALSASVFHIRQHDQRVGYRLVLYLDDAPLHENRQTYASLAFADGTYTSSTVKNEVVGVDITLDTTGLIVARTTDSSLAYDVFSWNGVVLVLERTLVVHPSVMPTYVICRYTDNVNQALLTYDSSVRGAMGVYIKDVSTTAFTDTDDLLDDLMMNETLYVSQDRNRFFTWNGDRGTINEWERTGTTYQRLRQELLTEYVGVSWFPVMIDRRRIVLSDGQGDQTVVLSRSFEVLNELLSSPSDDFVITPQVGGRLFRRQVVSDAAQNYVASYQLGFWTANDTIQLQLKIADETEVHPSVGFRENGTDVIYTVYNPTNNQVTRYVFTVVV